MPEVRKILFIAEGQLGDSIVLTPALRALKEKINGAHVSVLLLHRRKYADAKIPDKVEIGKSPFSGTAEVFLNNPYVDEVLELDRKALRSLKGFTRLGAEWRCIKFLQKQKYDAVVCTFPQNRFVIWSFLAGIKKRIGQKRQQFSCLLSDKPDIKRSDSGVLKYFCDLLKPLDVSCSSFETIYNIPSEAGDRANSFFHEKGVESAKKIIAIHPGAGDRDRQWPPKYYSELINELAKQPSYQVLLCYSEYDIQFVDELKRALLKPVAEVQTKTIADLAAIFKKCDLAIVHNSGPRHLAAAVGTKTLALLEKYDDIMWKIYDAESMHAIIQSNDCDSCNQNKCFGIIPKGEKYGAKCMHNIEVKDVYSRIESLLNIN